MRNIGLFPPIRISFVRAARALFAAGSAAALAACLASTALARTVLIDAPITLSPGTTTLALPSGTYTNQAARVRLRFADTPLHNRGGNSWNYTINLKITALDNTNRPVGSSQDTALTIFRGMDRESF